MYKSKEGGILYNKSKKKMQKLMSFSKAFPLQQKHFAKNVHKLLI